MQLRFNGPWEGWAVVPLENSVGYYGIDIFRVDQEAVHVKKGRTDAGWWGSAG